MSYLCSFHSPLLAKMSDRPSVRPLALGGSTCGPLEGAESSERTGEGRTEPEADKLELEDIGFVVEVLLVVVLDDDVGDGENDDEETVGLCDDTAPLVDATANPVDGVGDEQAERRLSTTTAPRADTVAPEGRGFMMARARLAPQDCMSQAINFPPFGLLAPRLSGNVAHEQRSSALNITSLGARDS